MQQISQQERIQEARPAQMPNLKPFLVDPLILARLNAVRASTLVVILATTCVTALATIWSSAASGLFLRSKSADALPTDLWLFVLRNRSNSRDLSVPYLRDYPSIVLTFTIAASVCLVYNLYLGAAKLHSDMEATGCIKYGEEGRVHLTTAINRVNGQLRRCGKFSPIAFFLALCFTIVTNLALKGKLFSFLAPGLYSQWWASLEPLRPGGVVWVLFGAIGIYMVYAEAVLGLTYVRFLRRLRNDYQFRANMLNPDGFFGWRRLRQLITNMQAGALCTLLSAWAVSFFLEPAAGTVATVMILSVFIGVVAYVFFAVNVNFRRQVRTDKRAQTEEVIEEITRVANTKTDAEGLLSVLVAYQRLEYISKIPSTPIRQRWLIAGALSVLGPISAIAVQLIKYFTT